MSRMPEAEVSLRLASWLISNDLVAGPVEVAIDGAQVQTAGVVHFDLPAFLVKCGWTKVAAASAWQCVYAHPDQAIGLRIHSNPGKG